MGHRKSTSKRKIIAINTYTEKEDGFLINTLKVDIRDLEKQEQTKPKSCRRKKIVELREETNKQKKNWRLKSILR